MKKNTRSRCRPGMSFLELSVITLVLLGLVSILFVGARAWKKGFDEDARRRSEHAALKQRAVTAEQKAADLQRQLDEKTSSPK